MNTSTSSIMPMSSPPMPHPPSSKLGPRPPVLRRRNLVVGSVLASLVGVVILVVVVYMIVFHPRVYYGQRVAFTTMYGNPPARLGLTTPTTPNGTAKLQVATMTPYILKSASNKKGQVQLGDEVLVWNPRTNTYLFANACAAPTVNKNKTNCDAITYDTRSATCVWTDGGACTPSSPTMPRLVFRPLTKGTILDNFKFKLTQGNSDAKVRIKASYALQTVTDSDYVQPGVTGQTLDLSNLGTKSWQLLK